MSYQLRSTPATDADVEDAFHWYESELAGLGRQFLDELRASYDSVQSGPLKYQTLRWDIRRALLRRFPYSVYFVVEGSSITVLAVLRATRDPSRWQERAKHRVSE